MPERVARPPGQASVWSDDPTRNVLNLVAAAIERQDDLREAESARLRELWQIQREHLRELRHAEKDRLDAIRGIDVAASGEANRLAEQRAQTLAKQTETMAETLRQQVSQTARESNAELKTALQPLMSAIEELRRWQYQQVGSREHVAEVRDVSGLRAVWLGLVAVVLFNIAAMVVAVMALRA